MLNESFKKGDIIYIGVIGDKDLICKQLEVFNTEGLIKDIDYVDSRGKEKSDEIIIQRVYINEDGLYLDVQINGEQCAVSRDKNKIIGYLKDLKEKLPLYYENLSGDRTKI